MQHLTIREIKEALEHQPVDQSLINQLKADSRKGVQKIAKALEQKEKKKKEQEIQWHKMMTIERDLYDQGYSSVVGIDEAGRGPLAGPVVSAAVILPKNFKLLGLTDSKQLNAKKREEYCKVILQEAVAAELSIIDAQEIDRINILEATKKAMKMTLSQMKKPIDYVLIDAVALEELPYPSQAIIKGDQKSVTIAAASILAKVTRDQIMEKIHQKYPEYHFDQNKGYGTKDHLEAIEQYGATPYHRRSFTPVYKRI